MGKESVCQLIEHSEDFKTIFNTEIQKIERCPVRGERVRNLAASKIRFASELRPMGRCITFLDALWSTADIILATRDSPKPKRVITNFVVWVNEERLITLGMMGDAGNTTSEVTRHHDTGSAEVSTMVGLLVRYVQTLDYQFLQRGCLTTGYTAHILFLLQKPRVIRINKDTIKTVGGPDSTPAVMVSRVLKRMASFVKLAVITVTVEWPDYHLLHAFCLFNLELVETLPHAGVNQQHDEWIARLSQCLGAEEGELRAQVCDYIHAALCAYECMSTECKSSLVAWKCSLQYLDRHTEKRHLNSILHQCVRLMNIFEGLTTSGLERVFKTGRMQNPLHIRDAWSEQREEDDIKVATDVRPDEEDLVIEKARMIWREYYGSPKASGAKRKKRWGRRRTIKAPL